MIGAKVIYNPSGGGLGLWRNYPITSADQLPTSPPSPGVQVVIGGSDIIDPLTTQTLVANGIYEFFNGGWLLVNSDAGGGGGTVLSVGMESSDGSLVIGGTNPVTTIGALDATLSETGVSAATYGSATSVPQFTVDAQGRLTSVVEVAIPGTENWWTVPAESDVSMGGYTLTQALGISGIVGAGAPNLIIKAPINTTTGLPTYIDGLNSRFVKFADAVVGVSASRSISSANCRNFFVINAPLPSTLTFTGPLDTAWNNVGGGEKFWFENQTEAAVTLAVTAPWTISGYLTLLEGDIVLVERDSTSTFSAMLINGTRAQENGVDQGSSQAYNFVDGTNTTVTVTTVNGVSTVQYSATQDGDASTWSQYPALQSVAMDGYNLESVGQVQILENGIVTWNNIGSLDATANSDPSANPLEPDLYWAGGLPINTQYDLFATAYVTQLFTDYNFTTIGNGTITFNDPTFQLTSSYLDGLTLAAGQYMMIVVPGSAVSDPVQAGLYLATQGDGVSVATAMIRYEMFNRPSLMPVGRQIQIISGTLYSQSIAVLTTGVGTINVDPVVFTLTTPGIGTYLNSVSQGQARSLNLVEGTNIDITGSLVAGQMSYTITAIGDGSGTVTSVGLSSSSLTLTGTNPVTTSGTINVEIPDTPIGLKVVLSATFVSGDQGVSTLLANGQPGLVFITDYVQINNATDGNSLEFSITMLHAAVPVQTLTVIEDTTVLSASALPYVVSQSYFPTAIPQPVGLVEGWDLLFNLITGDGGLSDCTVFVTGHWEELAP